MPVIPRREAPETSRPQPGLDVWVERRREAQSARRRYEPKWHLAQEYVSGRQWVSWSRNDRRVVSEPNPQKRERHTVNVLTAFLMTNVGKLVSDELAPELLFRQDDVQARDFAKQANQAVRYALEEEIDYEPVVYETFTRMAVHGLGAIQSYWDSTRGPVIAENVPYHEGQPILDPHRAQELMAGGPRPDVEMRPVRGHCCWRGYSVWNILPPPGIEHERDFPWLLVDEAVSIEKLRMQYGSAADGLGEERLSAVDLQHGGLGESSDDRGEAGGSPNLRGHVIRTTGYEMPTREHPQGRTVVFAQERMLDERPKLPLLIRGEPHIGLRFFKYYQLPGRFFPMGMIEPGLGPQRQRNRSRSQWIEWKDRAGLGRIYTRPGALSVQQLEGGKVAEVIEVRQGAEFPMETQGLAPGAWLAQDVQMHDGDLDRVMGMGSTGPGGPPPGIAAYASLAQLAESDNKRIGPILKAARAELSWLVRYTLHDIRTYWPPDKQVVLAGEDDAVSAFVFNSAKLPEDIYVRVGRGAPVPKDTAAEIQKVFDIYDRSVSSGTPLGVWWLYQSLQAGHALPVPETPQHVQIEKAQVEDLLIGRGGAVEVSPIDDHDIHISIHGQAAADHALIPGAEDVNRALMEHIAEHEQAKAQAGAGAPGVTAPALQGSMGGLGQQKMGAPVPPAAGVGIPGQGQ